jgi:glycerophosphoryl diester phosphodiesterase
MTQIKQKFYPLTVEELIELSASPSGSTTNGKFYALTREEFLELNQLLKDAELRVYLYLVTNHPWSDRKIETDTAIIAEHLKVSRRTVQRSLVKLKKLDLLPEWLLPQLRDHNPVEEQIRNRLQSEIGGLSEVSTPVGRIDLLTKTEIIEVKNLKDWKAALGQILVYSAFYPEHQKRIHLFGSQTELEKLTDIEIACLEFNLRVTGEVVTATRGEK